MSVPNYPLHMLLFLIVLLQKVAKPVLSDRQGNGFIAFHMISYLLDPDPQAIPPARLFDASMPIIL